MYFQKNVRVSQLKNNHNLFLWYNNVDFWRDKNSKKKIWDAAIKPINIWDVNIDNIVISKLI